MMRRKKKQGGVAAIEFVMGFMLFWWICMAWVEVSYMSYVSAVSDLAVSESSRASRLEDSVDSTCEVDGCLKNYSDRFKQALNDTDSLWAKFVDPSKFRFSIQFLKTPLELENLKDNYCPLGKGETQSECGTSADSSIAVYRINYDYQPMFNYFINSSQLFSREVIVIQEYERDQFKY
ncbi:pilus assembly protein [Vibrio kasasachensis]|uniref:TadE/TadG family type IV pilus assembly protein n=1 Tax=Vibrio kasasachensis TaxID=2910248 RepID=UPI003D13E841